MALSKIVLSIVLGIALVISSCTKDSSTEPEGVNVFDFKFGGAKDDIAQAIQQANDKGFILAGFTNSFGEGLNDIYVVKTDNKGKEIWSHTYGSTDDERATSIKQTVDGDYIISGYTGNAENPDDANYKMLFLKIDSMGNEIWQKTSGDSDYDICKDIVATTDGNSIAVGYTKQGNLNIIKLNSSGEKVWDKGYSHTGSLIPYSIKEIPNEGFVIVSSISKLNDSASDIHLLKIDNEGNSVLSKRIESDGSCSPTDLLINSGGNFLIAGEKKLDSSVNSKMFLLNVNPNGTIIWTKTYGDEASKSHSIFQTSDGSYVIAGENNNSGCFIKIGKDGEEIFHKNLEYQTDSYISSAHEAVDGGFILGGTAYSTDGWSDFFLVKTDEDGSY